MIAPQRQVLMAPALPLPGGSPAYQLDRGHGEAVPRVLEMEPFGTAGVPVRHLRWSGPGPPGCTSLPLGDRDGP